MIPYARQLVTESDIDSVVEVLRSTHLTQGMALEMFQEALSCYCKVRYSIAVCNATAALYIACRAIDLKEGDIVWTSPNTFVASANCALLCGAKVDFVDIELSTYTLSTQHLEKKLIHAKKFNILPKVIIPVHFAGQSCSMEKIKKLSEEYGFYIIEDASHAIGGKYNGEPIGSCRYSDMCVFSFHAVKIITTGEGGAITTNNPKLKRKLELLRSHEITRDESEMIGRKHGPWYYQQIGLSGNYRLTDIQAALGLSQLKHLDEFVAKRNELAISYASRLDSLPLVTPCIKLENYSSYHLYVVLVDQEKTRATRFDLFQYLLSREIGVNVHYIPVHTQPYFKKLGFNEGDYPNSEQYYKNAITLPLHLQLSESEFEYIVESLHYFFVKVEQREAVEYKN